MRTILIAAIIISIALAACASDIEREQREDLRLQQDVIDELKDENAALRDANDLLRASLMQERERALRNEEIVKVCRENYPPLANRTFESIAPLTHVPITDVLLSREKVIIDVPDLQEGIISATRSMEPFLDENDIVLERAPSNPAEIHENDVIVYERGGVRIVHRVVEIGHDDAGWYAWTKGDNNLGRDADKVRFADVRGVVVGIIY